MSDLLPLLSATLRDKVVSDARDEIQALRRVAHLASCVEIVRSAYRPNDDDDDDDDDDDNDEDDNQPQNDQDPPLIVLASAQIQDGRYGNNPRFWEVRFSSPSPEQAICPLADLRQCRLCVGGGIQLESFDETQVHRASVDGVMDPQNEDDGDNAKTVSFCFAPNAMWIQIIVHGWPHEDWQRLLQPDADVDGDGMIEFLVSNVAERFPQATVEFRSVAFLEDTVHGALQRFLPPGRLEQSRAERDTRRGDYDDDTALAELHTHVMFRMRDLGVQAPAAAFIPQVNQIMNLLTRVAIYELTEENEPLIDEIIRAQQTGGGFDDLEDIIQQIEELRARGAPLDEMEGQG